MNRKNKLKQLIHVGKNQLGLDEGTYRQILTNKTGKNSTKTMTITELELVLKHLKSKGFTVTPTDKTKDRAGKLKQADDPQSKKIRALWLELYNLGAVRNPSERALAKYIERQTGASALQFLRTATASRVIEAMKQWKLRVEKQQKQTDTRQNE